MEGDSLRARIVALLQRSRQAHRLYSSMERGQRGEAAEYSELQAAEWRLVNGELMRQLATLLESGNVRTLGAGAQILRDRYHDDFRAIESELHRRHKELLEVSEKGDFIKCALLSRQLVVLKAKHQATQAVKNELDCLTMGPRAVKMGETAEPPIEEAPVPMRAKVIPLRGRM